MEKVAALQTIFQTYELKSLLWCCTVEHSNFARYSGNNEATWCNI